VPFSISFLVSTGAYRGAEQAENTVVVVRFQTLVANCTIELI